ncbi:DUF2065 domain-containing protein [Silanimonas sp.]|uniref:DUF2065 domain-containing protein n=1 Tax=Silanimonas sp. TaxID=1929290 RepID=UPI001BC02A53|nr:DUF2065 domain-containing protein [Silanimonas sp.]MBS3895339.1 DUF2065 domain-containing protein [Silanimonas sp.]
MDWADLFTALALVLVIEGLFLALAPGAWKRMVREMLEEPERRLQAIGAGLAIFGLLLLAWVRA